MSHRRVHSHGTVPFSWEDSPGVSKIIGEDKIKIEVSSALNSKTTSFLGGMLGDEIKINPPPPCPNLQSTRSSSAKGIKWWQEDPFVAAYKECTKNKGRNAKNGKVGGQKKSVGGCSNKLVVRSKLIFSCKNSSDVKEDSFVKLSNLPPIPRSRVIRAR